MKTQQIEDKILTQLLAADPEKTIRLHAAEFTPTQIDRCCLHWPELMLVWATDLLDDEQFAYCCLRVPRPALDEFSRRLGPELFDSCVEACPEAALSRVLERLTDRQFDRSVQIIPRVPYLTQT